MQQDFGKRLQNLRKQKKMTQEDLADRLGVTGQAVSKWENGQSYPDITLLPTISTIFDMPIDFLFGNEHGSGQASASMAELRFPPMYENLPLVHSFLHVACYSVKPVANIDGSGVKFTDGSTAELSNRLTVNNGQGDIIFLAHDEMEGYFMSNDPSKTEAEYEFPNSVIKAIDVEVLSNICNIVESLDQICRVHAKGEARFIAMLVVQEINGTLSVRFNRQDDQGNRSHRDNSIIIEIPAGSVNHVEVKINGSGSLTSGIPYFDTGGLHINGSGNIQMNEFRKCGANINGSGDIKAVCAEEAELSINGSGDMDWGQIGKASVNINGSGDVDIDSAESLHAGINGSGDISLGKISGGDFSARINGSGDININEGTCGRFDVDIQGSGDVDAKGVTAKKASIIIHQNGSVTLGRVIESSTEQVKRKGKIRILHRGE